MSADCFAEREPREAIEHTGAVFDSVTIVSLDPDGILGRLRATARLLRNGQNEVDSAWLFGSLVKGDVVPGSDADLVVLFKDSDRPRHECLTDDVGAFSGVGIGVEVLSYMRGEIDRLSADGNSLFRSILERRLSQ